MISEATISEFFLQYAYSPNLVYLGVVLFMTLSSFGLPIPEEVVLVSCGLISYMAMHPKLFTPPSADAIGVNLYLLSTICFLAVVCSDLLVFFIGKYFGPKLFSTKFFKKNVSNKRLSKINVWFQKYGAWACGIFRFTPGIRFPGHMTCGMMGVKWWKFLAVDSLAALVSVPTQVILVAIYGEVILAKFKEFKIILFSVLTFFIIFYFVKKKFEK
jgi:membrane protein DedA with SNARE-associated domain